MAPPLQRLLGLDPTLRRQIESRGFPQQSWGIVEKIREVDTALRKDPNHQNRVFEIHTELSFSQMAGEPMKHPKKKPAAASNA